MTDTRPFDPALFQDAAIDPETANLNAQMIELLTGQPEWWIVGAQASRAACRRGEGPFPTPGVLGTGANHDHHRQGRQPNPLARNRTGATARGTAPGRTRRCYLSVRGTPVRIGLFAGEKWIRTTGSGRIKLCGRAVPLRSLGRPSGGTVQLYYLRGMLFRGARRRLRREPWPSRSAEYGHSVSDCVGRDLRTTPKLRPRLPDSARANNCFSAASV
jgi:hypothetical protein